MVLWVNRKVIFSNYVLLTVNQPWDDTKVSRNSITVSNSSIDTNDTLLAEPETVLIKFSMYFYDSL